MKDLGETRILNLEACDIYYHYLTHDDIKIPLQKEQFDERFSDIVPPNLDFYYLESQGKFSRKKLENEYYSFDFINVSFKYHLFLDADGKQIIPNKDNKVADKKDVNEIIRKHLYLNGFILNNKKYVRYKRSSGAAKAGSCLFIKESLYPLMDKWSRTGLNEDRDKCFKNLTSYEAYKALSLSSIVATLDLKPENILFVKDVKVLLKNQDVIKVTYNEKKKRLVSEECVTDVENNIFDGEGLLDVSVFKKAKKTDKGMMLLRSRFFKCCAFNTKLQKWFSDNGITDVSQLEGITSAEHVRLEDIVLVASESCLKYLKMCKKGFHKNSIKRWCNEINKDEVKFGVVKYDKPSRFFYGEMVETTYQLLNSLQLKYTDILGLVSPYLNYIGYIRNLRDTPEFVRFFLEDEDRDYSDDPIIDDTEDSFNEDITDSLLEYSSYSFKNKICLELARLDSRVKYTGLFKTRVLRSIVDSLLYKLYNGRVLVHGTYTTLLGNPYEFLKYTIKQFNPKKPESLLGDGEIYCSFFEDGQELVGSRAPHTTMGNVLYVRNKKLKQIDEYFNLTKEIVVVDAINNNIQQRLSGCDYDSDSMLLTDNDVLVKAAKLNYSKFPVPYTGFDSDEKQMKECSANKKDNILNNLYEIDKTIANNCVGQIVNLSQLLNSHLWNKFGRGKDNSYKDLYGQIAILAVLSGAEIDSAKRSFPFETDKQYKNLKRFAKKSGYLEEEATPLFFAILSRDNYNRRPSISDIKKKCRDDNKITLKTTMDTLWGFVAERYTDSQIIKTDTIPFFDLFKHDYRTEGVQSDVYHQVDKALEHLDQIKKVIDDIRDKTKDNDFELKKANFNTTIRLAYKKLKTVLNTPLRAKLLINKLEELDDGYSKMFILLYIIHQFSNELGYSYKTLLAEDRVPLSTLERVYNEKDADYTLFSRYFYKCKNFVKK